MLIVLHKKKNLAPKLIFNLSDTRYLIFKKPVNIKNEKVGYTGNFRKIIRVLLSLEIFLGLITVRR